MIGYPLDSQVTFEPDGTPIYDRAISSAPLRKLLHELFSDGVLPNPSTNLQVVVGDSGMTVKVNPGFAMVNGCMKLEETQRTLEIQAASSAYDRIDTIVVRLNDEANARICDLYVRQGTPASSPVRPDLVRSGSVYEIGLADVFIPRNTSTIAQQRITDTRYETARCGIISSISQFDTTTLYNQIQSDLAGFKTEEQQQFMDWFENLVYVLDGDVAGHLQNEIDATDARVDEIETQIGTTDISAIGDGKITGAISSLNSTLNNKFATVTLTISANSWARTSYPNGFTKTNCVVIGLQAESGGSGEYRFGYGLESANVRFFAQLNASDIGLFTSDTTLNGRKAIVTLMRID